MRRAGATRKGTFVNKNEETVTYPLSTKQADRSGRETSDTVVQSSNSDSCRAAGCFAVGGTWPHILHLSPGHRPSVHALLTLAALLCVLWPLACALCPGLLAAGAPQARRGRTSEASHPPSGDIPGGPCPRAPAQCPHGSRGALIPPSLRAPEKPICHQPGSPCSLCCP